MRMSVLIGTVATSFIASATASFAEDVFAPSDFRRSISMPYTVLAAERVRGMQEGMGLDIFSDQSEPVQMLEVRAGLILREFGSVVSRDMVRAARDEGRELARKTHMDQEGLDEQAMVALLLPTYLEAEHDELASWARFTGIDPLEADRFAILTISAGLHDMILGDDPGAADLVFRSQEIIQAAPEGTKAATLYGYQTQVLSTMGNMSTVADVDQALQNFSVDLRILPLTMTESVLLEHHGA